MQKPDSERAEETFPRPMAKCDTSDRNDRIKFSS